MKTKRLHNQLKRIKRLGESCCIQEHFPHFIEEVGEVAKDIAEGNLNHCKKELVDTFIALMAMYSSLGGTKKEFYDRLERSISKWESNEFIDDE